MHADKFVSGEPVDVAVALPERPRVRPGNFIQYTASRLKNLPFTQRKTLNKPNPAAMQRTMFFALMLAVVIVPHVASATDLMASQTGDATDTFGLNSTVLRWIYMGEIVMSLVGFIKTRNPLIFVGLVIMLVISRALYGMIGT
ncbi:type IV conjugative transfer system pilin TraA [Pantoea allii]|uniref:Pilin n=1 Tax=Pantoea allii TaxID=574096 RepID=A0A2V2BHQ1_9GAMM|nr:type IV conjugative transfer system pilin TraA [Pantoea allii]PWK94362.1 type IV conjugative transfer system pilin TraA [Pantoea allii]